MGVNFSTTNNQKEEVVYNSQDSGFKSHSLPGSGLLQSKPKPSNGEVFFSSVLRQRAVFYGDKNKVILQSPGYRGYEDYLKIVNKDANSWMLMHDLEGRIYEKERSRNYSVFGVTSGHLDDNFGQGLLLTDIDLDKTSGNELKIASSWRIKKAMSQRAFYLSLCNSPERINKVLKLDSKYGEKITSKKPIYHPLFEKYPKHAKEGASPDPFDQHRQTKYFDYKDFGYLTRYSRKRLSRNKLFYDGIYTKLGKYTRSLLTLSPMPDASGSLDAITTSCMSHMLSIIPRNLRFSDIDYQVSFAKAVIAYLNNFILPENLQKHAKKIKRVWLRNVCAAIGTQYQDLERFEKLYQSGIRSFRLYSIATGIRIFETTSKLVSYMAEKGIEDVELFVGQITTIEQFLDLYSKLGKKKWQKIHGFYIGNGGGSRCKTAETGMIVNSPYLSYQIKNSGLLEDKSLIVEGGVSTEPAAALLLGANGLSYSAGITGGCIESPGGALYIYSNSKDEYWKPYRGEASPSAKMIEGVVYPTGDAKHVEGSNGFVRMEKKYPSMTGRIWVLNEWIAQSLVKLAVDDIYQLSFLGTTLDKTVFKKIFSEDPDNIPDATKVANPSSNKVSNMYTIPLPLHKRSDAQRKVASSHGLVGESKVTDVKDVDYTVRIPLNNNDS